MSSGKLYEMFGKYVNLTIPKSYIIWSKHVVKCIYNTLHKALVGSFPVLRVSATIKTTYVRM